MLSHFPFHHDTFTLRNQMVHCAFLASIIQADCTNKDFIFSVRARRYACACACVLQNSYMFQSPGRLIATEVFILQGGEQIEGRDPLLAW